MHTRLPLMFGIPTLDELLEVPGSALPIASNEESTELEASARPTPGSNQSQDESTRSDATTMSILGPDGSGKSVLALHLASQYRAWCCANLEPGAVLPRIIYVSSDFKYESAKRVWNIFGLDRPFARHIPFERVQSEIDRRYERSNGSETAQPKRRVGTIRLMPIAPDVIDDQPSGRDTPIRDMAAVDFLVQDERTGGSAGTVIGFFDLARYTAGDDWHFVNSLIVNLQRCPRPMYVGHPSGGNSEGGTPGGGKPYPSKPVSHLVIIDSVEGFETLIGTRDAHGIEHSRRARIAQSMRHALDLVHLVFVVEEPGAGQRLPEEYVTDIVVRLRTRRDDGGHTLRTVEIEKARARNHAVGEHTFEIRDSRGSSTGNWENPDQPATDNSYVHVFHSLPHRNLLVSGSYGPGLIVRKDTVASFGLPYLDRLLASHEHTETPDTRGKPEASWGIRESTAAALIGDAGTGKSVLGEQFLANGFRTLVEDALNMYTLLSRRRGSHESPSFDITVERVMTALSAGNLKSESRQAGMSADCPEALKNQLETVWNEGDKQLMTAVRAAEKARRVPKISVHPPTTVPARQQLLEDRKSVRRKSISMESSVELGAADGQSAGSEGDTGRVPRSRSDLHGNLQAFLNATTPRDSVLALFRHPYLRRPSVLLTTGDRVANKLSERCLGYLRDTVKSHLPDDDATKTIALAVLLKIIEEQLIVRRFDIDNITGSALFDTIQRNMIEAQYLIHGPFFPPDQETRYRQAARIRVVIDDMRVLANLCPAVAQDSAFLPYLVFWLEREGMTTLIVHTDDLRPGSRPDDPISKELISLLRQLILTWSVPFEGQSRVAISAIPAASKETNGIVREVEIGRLRVKDTCLSSVITLDLPKVDVTRHLELYADLEAGRPRLVPLAVYLFAATPACRRYMDGEDILHRFQFLPVPGLTRGGESGRVLWPVDSTEYYAIRDLTHLPWDVKADHTIVDQVDSFWSLDYETGGLASQYEYLTREGRTEHDDSFGIFRGKPLWCPPGREIRIKGRRLSMPYARQRFFRNANYQSRIFSFSRHEHDPEGMPDRVPFLWDFSFIVVPADPWKRAATNRIRYFDAANDREDNGAAPQAASNGSKKEPPQEATDPDSVGAVLEGLSESWKARSTNGVGWRKFLGACAVVAEQARSERGGDPVPFDYAATSAEAVLSLILEIWFSEMTQTVNAGDADEGFKRVWQKWQTDRLTSSEYKPLGPRDPERRWYSLAALIRDQLEVEVKTPGHGRRLDSGTSVSDRFRAFWKEYQANVLDFLTARGGHEKDGTFGERWNAFSPRDDREPRQVAEFSEAARQYDVDPATKQARTDLFRRLPTAALCLYKTWLLLLDVFDFKSALAPDSVFESREPKDASPAAVAVRHYYRTACDEQARRSGRGTAEPQIVLAMPGHFSTRGDTFLAAAQASRSQLLASHAIDLLCSRRANLSRMQVGMGLPVRDVMEDGQCRVMRTALRGLNKDGFTELKYHELCELGGPPPPSVDSITTPKSQSMISSPAPENEASSSQRPDSLQWLFRNGMPDYDRVSRAMQKWLMRLFQWTVSYRTKHVLGWNGGFEAYDALQQHRFAPCFTYSSFDHFGDLCDYLAAELNAAERPDDR